MQKTATIFHNVMLLYAPLKVLYRKQYILLKREKVSFNNVWHCVKGTLFKGEDFIGAQIEIIHILHINA